jgi:hypothetical protein
MGVVLIIKNTSKPWMEVARIIKNILVVIVALLLFFWSNFEDLFLAFWEL